MMKKLISILLAAVMLMTMFPVMAFADTKTDAKKILETMTIEEKVGQLFMVRPESLKESGKTSTKVTSEMKKNIKKYHLGGIILFGQNIKDPQQIKEYTAALQKAAPMDMFIAVDEEGGIVARIANNSNFSVKKYDSMMAVGKSGRKSDAKAAGKTIGRYLKKYGFNLDLAPVADIYTNPNNQVIGSRAFGTTSSVVSKMVDGAIDGFHAEDMMCCLKHYPGHGDTSADTHTGKVYVKKSWNSMKKRELVPFIDNMDDTDMIMASHIRCTGVLENAAPASCSYTMITKKLRKELGYNGVVITDGMGMKAVSGSYSSKEAAIKSIKAGCDIILCPVNFENAYNGVLKAVKRGEIKESRIDKSVLRILELKLKYGIIDPI